MKRKERKITSQTWLLLNSHDMKYQFVWLTCAGFCQATEDEMQKKRIKLLEMQRKRKEEQEKKKTEKEAEIAKKQEEKQ